MEEKAAVIHVELYSEKLKALKIETLNFSVFPATIREIKDKVEECCSIPACVQRVFYQNNEVADTSSPESLYIRSWDTLKVSYPIEGETEDVKNVIQWLHLVIAKFQEILGENEGKNGFTIPYDPIYSSDNANVLIRTLFSPWSNPVKYVNGKHFDALQGVELLANLHRLILELKKHSPPSRILQYLEYIMVSACSNFAMSKSCARRLLHYGELDNSISTFLMKSADDASLAINNQFSIVEMAMSTILNISEIPEVQESLSARSDVIRQCFLAANTTIYSSDTPLDVMIFLLCISRCQEAHVNLLKPDLVGDIIDLCKKNETILDLIKSNVLKTYAGVVLAHIICGSSHLLQKLPYHTLLKIKSLMQQVCSFDPMELRDYERHNGVYWQTFQNCVEYLYIPLSLDEAWKDFTNRLVIRELYQLSVGILLHYLQSALGRNDHVEAIIEEKLMDFVVALPWNVSSFYKDKAKCVIRELAKIYPIQPLSLSSLAKAKLAKSTWGLKKIMEIQSLQELM